MPRKNPPDATKKEVALLRQRVVKLERAVKTLGKLLAPLGKKK